MDDIELAASEHGFQRSMNTYNSMLRFKMSVRAASRSQTAVRLALLTDRSALACQ